MQKEKTTEKLSDKLSNKISDKIPDKGFPFKGLSVSKQKDNSKTKDSLSKTDKRIIKTKKNLKQTMIKLLTKRPFEKISVSELCRTGDTSRITFYTHYDDKYDLIEEIFKDYVKDAVDDYYALQEKNNPHKNPFYGYYNLLDCIFNLYVNNRNLFAMIDSEKNPYLYSAFYQHIYRHVHKYIIDHQKYMQPKYPPHQMASFICNGLWGVITECCNTEENLSNVHQNIMDMFNDILKSDIFKLKPMG